MARYDMITRILPAEFDKDPIELAGIEGILRHRFVGLEDELDKIRVQFPGILELVAGTPQDTSVIPILLFRGIRDRIDAIIYFLDEMRLSGFEGNQRTAQIETSVGYAYILVGDSEIYEANDLLRELLDMRHELNYARVLK